MGRDVVFANQYWTGASPEQVARLRGAAEEVARFVDDSPAHGLGRWWQAVPYLMTGRVDGSGEPLRWFTSGGEMLAENEAGPVRWLSPAEVSRLADALADESPDDLGEDHYDEVAMDAAGVYPARWVLDGEDYDPLGTIRELYSYLREFLSARKRDGEGVIVFLKKEVAYAEDDEEESEASAAPAPEAERPVGAVILIGEEGRWYTRADAAAHPNLTARTLADADERLAALGYRHVGDFAAEGTDVLRGYVSADGTTVAIAYLSERGLGSWTFLARLGGDALVVASDAFTQERAKRKLLALSLPGAGPAELHASLVERRDALAERHGPPVVLEPTLRSAAHAWDTYGLKSRSGRRR